MKYGFYLFFFSIMFLVGCSNHAESGNFTSLINQSNGSNLSDMDSSSIQKSTNNITNITSTEQLIQFLRSAGNRTLPNVTRNNSDNKSRNEEMMEFLLSKSKKYQSNNTFWDFSYENFTQKNRSSGKEIPVECKTTADIYKCIEDISQDTKDLQLCKLLSVRILVDSCIMDRIEENSIKDFRYCELFENVLIKSNCYSHMAQINNNKALCLNTRGSDVCLKTIAFRLNDSSICQEITDDITKQMCLAELGTNEEKCFNLKGKPAFWEATCLENIAFRKKDISVCGKIKDSSYQDRCLASIDGNISHCLSGIPISDDLCIIATAVRFADVELCEQIEFIGIFPGVYRTECVALVKRDTNYCDEIDVRDMITECKKEVNRLKTNSYILFLDTMI